MKANKHLLGYCVNIMSEDCIEAEFCCDHQVILCSYWSMLLILASDWSILIIMMIRMSSRLRRASAPLCVRGLMLATPASAAVRN